MIKVNKQQRSHQLNLPETAEMQRVSEERENGRFSSSDSKKANDE
jgi:hypothetical protein